MINNYKQEGLNIPAKQHSDKAHCFTASKLDYQHVKSKIPVFRMVTKISITNKVAYPNLVFRVR